METTYYVMGNKMVFVGTGHDEIIIGDFGVHDPIAVSLEVAQAIARLLGDEWDIYPNNTNKSDRNSPDYDSHFDPESRDYDFTVDMREKEYAEYSADEELKPL
jgi:hypothetical protein